MGADNYARSKYCGRWFCVYSRVVPTHWQLDTSVAFANTDDGSCVLEPCTGGDCPFDFNEDGEIGSADLLGFLNSIWRLLVRSFNKVIN